MVRAMIYKRLCIHSIITDIENSRTGKFNLFLNYSRNKYDKEFKNSSVDLNPYNDVHDKEFFRDVYDIFNSYKLINYKISNTDISRGMEKYTNVSIEIIRERYNQLINKYELLDFQELKSILKDLTHAPSMILLIKMYVNDKITLNEIFYVIKYFSKTYKMGDLYKNLKVKDLSVIEALPDENEEYILEDNNVKKLYAGFHNLSNYLKLESDFKERDDLDIIYKIFYLHEKVEELMISNDSEYSKILMMDDITSYLDDKVVFLDHSTLLYDEVTYLSYLIKKTNLKITPGDCLFDIDSPYKKGSPGFRKMADLNRFVTTTWMDKDNFPEFHERVFKATRSLMFPYSTDKINVLQLLPKHRKDIRINNFNTKLFMLFMNQPHNGGVIKLIYPYLIEYESYLSKKYGKEVDALKVLMGRYEINEKGELDVDYDSRLSKLEVDVDELGETLEKFNNFMVKGGNPNYKYNRHIKKTLMKLELLR